MDRNKTKFVVRNIAGWCAGAVVVTVVKQNTYPKNKLHQAELAVGSVVIGSMVSDEIARYTDRFVDQLFNAFEKEQDPIVLVH